MSNNLNHTSDDILIPNTDDYQPSTYSQGILALIIISSILGLAIFNVIFQKYFQRYNRVNDIIVEFKMTADIPIQIGDENAVDSD